MGEPHHFDHRPYRVEPGQPVDLGGYATTSGEELDGKKAGKRALAADVAALAEAQSRLWADGRQAVLVVLQGMDAAGKDGTIRHVMSGVNPQGVGVHSFRAPSEEELDHHFLWRPTRYLPGKGRIAIFNRSYYEEVLVVRVHPELLDKQRLPTTIDRDEIWRKRFDDINAFEHSLVRNGTTVVKVFLHLSKEEQRKRFLDRLNEPEKHWKFNEADVRDRRRWDEYQRCYEEMLAATSTRWAPWYVAPADDKWFTRALIADVLAARIEELDLHPPSPTPQQLAGMAAARKELES